MCLGISFFLLLLLLSFIIWRSIGTIPISTIVSAREMASFRLHGGVIR